MNPAPPAASLYETFATVPDPRSRFGRSYTLASLLTLSAVAMLCGCRSLEAIAQWGSDYNHRAPLLGFTRPTKDRDGYRTPRVSELHTVFAALDVAAFEAVLTRWVGAQGVCDLAERIVALDGKTLPGSQGHQLPGVHLLAASCRDVEAVLAQLAVPGKTNEPKTALELLKLIPRKGTLITGDAAFTQRDLCEAVIRGEGDYFLTVKENQPTLGADIRAACGPASSPSGGQAASRPRRPGPDPR